MLAGTARSPRLGLIIASAGLVGALVRAHLVQRAWQHAHPGGMGVTEAWLRLVVETTAISAVVLAVLAGACLVISRQTRLARLCWSIAPLGLFWVLVPPREAAFFAAGAVDDFLIGPAAAGCCVAVTNALGLWKPRLLGLVSTGASLALAAFIASLLLSTAEGDGLEAALEACRLALSVAAGSLICGSALHVVERQPQH